MAPNLSHPTTTIPRGIVAAFAFVATRVLPVLFVLFIVDV